MRQGTGITPAVNYSVGTGELLSLTKKDVKRMLKEIKGTNKSRKK